jgi:hypothetical protein
MATIDGSETTIPRPRAYTRVFAVPRSIARSLENKLNKDFRIPIYFFQKKFDSNFKNCPRKFAYCGSTKGNSARLSSNKFVIQYPKRASNR